MVNAAKSRIRSDYVSEKVRPLTQETFYEAIMTD
jgi:hypothetical protein